MRLPHRHIWIDVTTPYNHLSVTHLQCIKCGKIISAFEQKYKRTSQARVEIEVSKGEKE